MSEPAQNNTSEDDLRSSLQTNILGRLSRLCLKELREILRDRRTMITLLLILSLVLSSLICIVLAAVVLFSTFQTIRDQIEKVRFMSSVEFL